MKISYSDFVNNVKDASTFEKKAEIKGHELAKIRNRIKLSDNNPGCPRIVAKLIFLEMEGENTKFGQIEVVSLMANPRFSHKLIGYIGASILTDSNSETTLLMTQTILKDIENKNDPNCQCLGLAAVANIGGSDLLTAAAIPVQKELSSKNARVVKNAAMAALKIVKTCPELCETFRKNVPNLLNSSEHSVMLSGINLAIGMMKSVSSLSQQWKTFIRPFIDLLRDLKHNTPTKDYNFHLFNDPFLQCQTLRAIGLINQKSDELDGLLQEIITDLNCHTNTGRSILIEASETIKLVSKSQSLKILAINQIGRLLDLKSSAVIYSALSAFSRLLMSNKSSMIDRTSSDSSAMQRYRSQIVRYLEHHDLSIRRRSLDVISAIINENNVTELVPEIIRYMKLVDIDFRGEIVPKLYSTVQRFAPDASWNIDSTIHIIIDNANFIGNDIISSFCNLIAANADLRLVSLESLENVLVCYGANQPLTQIAAFCIGEYETKNENIIEELMQVAMLPKQLSKTICYILTALAKLAVRFNRMNDVTKYLQKFSTDNRLDVQQRAGEMIRILKMPNRSDFLLPMNDENDDQIFTQLQKQIQMKRNDDSPKNLDTESLIDINNNDHVSTNRKQIDSLLDIESDEIINAPKNGILAFERPDFVTYFEVQKNAKDQRQVAIRVSFFNKTYIALNNFVASFGVPDGWSLTAQSPTSSSLASLGSSPTTQVLLLMNHNNGKTPLSMRAQVSYLFRSQPITEMCQVNNIFS